MARFTTWRLFVLGVFALASGVATASIDDVERPIADDQAKAASAVEVFVDFDATVDGDGTEASPWNTLVGKPIEGGAEVTVWLSGEANPMEIPASIEATAPGVEVLRVMSRHLVDPSATPAHITSSIPVSELARVPIRQGVDLYLLPSGAGEFVTVLRDWRIPAHRTIPPEGLQPGLAFDRDYVETFRITEESNTALPPVATLNALDTVDTGYVPFLSTFYLKTLSGDAPGTGAAAPHRAVIIPPRVALLSFNAFGDNQVETIEIAGLTVSLHLGKADRRALAVNPALNVTVRDCLFVSCGDDDNIACVNGGGSDRSVKMIRNQHINVGDDGGPIVVSTQGGKPAYGSLEIRDQVVHFGYRINLLDGTSADLETAARFGVGSFHPAKVERAHVTRNIALSYYGKDMIPFQFPVGLPNLPANVRDPDAFSVLVDDVYIDRTSRINDFNMSGVHVTRSYFGRSMQQVPSLFTELSPALFSSCVFEVDSEYSVLGNIGEFDTAFINCTVRVAGASDVALFGVGSEPGRVFLRDMVFERVGGAEGVRFANRYGSTLPPLYRPDAILGWDGTPDLGGHWFGPGTIEATPQGLQSPAFSVTPSSLAQFEAMHGAALNYGATGAESLPVGASPFELASAYSGGVVGPQSTHLSGPVGLNGQGFSARLGAFQTGHPGACSMADLAFPYGVVDLSDVDAFIAAFLAADDAADLAVPAGIVDLSDVDRFVSAFLGECGGSW